MGTFTFFWKNGKVSIVENTNSFYTACKLAKGKMDDEDFLSQISLWVSSDKEVSKEYIFKKGKWIKLPLPPFHRRWWWLLELILGLLVIFGLLITNFTIVKIFFVLFIIVVVIRLEKLY